MIRHYKSTLVRSPCFLFLSRSIAANAQLTSGLRKTT